MFKKILLVIAVIIIILSAIYIFKFKSEEKNIYQAIPGDALYVISINDPIKLWTDFENSTFWHNFQDTKIANNVQLTFSEIRKKLGAERNQKLLQILFKKQVSVVISKTGNQYDFLLMADIGLTSQLMQFLSNIKKQLFPESRDIKYEQLKVNNTNGEIIKLLEERKEIVYTFIHNIVVVGDNISLVKKCVLAADEEIQNLSENEGFINVNKNLTEEIRVRLYVNSGLIFPQLKEQFVEPLDPLTEELLSISNYLGIGLRWEQNGIVLKGFSSLTFDSTRSNIDLLLTQKPQTSKLSELCPRNSWAMTSLTFSDFQDIWQFGCSRLQEDPEARINFQNSRHEVEEDLEINLERDLLSWIGSEIGVISLPIQYYGQKEKGLIFISTKDISQAKNSLEYIKSAIEKKKPIVFKEKDYKGCSISYMDLPFYLKVFFNPIFKRMTKPYWTIIENYVIFSDKMKSLEYVIDVYRSGDNLSADTYFDNLNDFFPDKNNIFVYLNMKQSLNSLRLNLDRSAISTLHKWQPYLEKLKSLGMSLNNSGDGLENIIYLQLQPKTAAAITLRWNMETRGKIIGPPNAANIDEIPGDELIFGDESGCIQIVTFEGRNIEGWPRYFEDAVINSPAAGDVNRDKKPEIVIAVGNKLFIMNQKGSNLNSDWPKTLPVQAFASPVLNDLDGDKKLDIILATTNKTVNVWNWEGENVDGWPQGTTSPIRATPAVGDINGDGHAEIVVAAMDGQLYVWSSDGQLLNNWPQATQAVITSAPILADITGDDNLEIIVGAWNGSVYVWQKDGYLISNWPQETGAIISAAPAVADLNDDGQPEILIGSENRKLYVWNRNGELLPGWPQTTLDKIKTSPVVADINDDEQVEVIIASEDGKVYAFDVRGKLLPGWPLRGSTTPILGDFDLNGKIDLAVGSWDKNFYYWSLTGKYQQQYVQWAKFHGDGWNTGERRIK